MAQAEFPGNSQKAVEAAPEPDREIRAKQVVVGEVTQRKPGLGKRFKETFLGGDAKGAASFVLMDIIVPYTKDAIADATQGAVERMLWGQTRSASRRGHVPGAAQGLAQQAYNKMYAAQPQGRPGIMSPRGRATHNFQEYVAGSRVEAEAVIDQMFDLLSQFQVVTVADFYDMIGESSHYTDQKWGWVDLRGAQVQRVTHGYLIDVPKPIALD